MLELGWSCSTQDVLRYPVGDQLCQPHARGHAGAVCPLQGPPGAPAGTQPRRMQCWGLGTAWLLSAGLFSNVNRPLHRKPPLLQKERGSGPRGSLTVSPLACRAKAEMLLCGVFSAHRDEEGGLGFSPTITH